MRNSYNKLSLIKSLPQKNTRQSSNNKIAFSKTYTDPLLTEHFREEYNVSLTATQWEEYDLGVIPEEDINIQKNEHLTVTASLEAPYLVESFEDKYVAAQPNTLHAQKPYQNGNQVNNNISNQPTTPVANPNPRQEQNQTDIQDNLDHFAETESLSNEEDEDEFIRDMKAILTGGKKFDETNKKVVSKSEAQNVQALSPATPPDNRNAIFEQLSQSMKYANAYDLGDIDIEQRFNDFDVLSESKAKINKPISQNFSSATAKPTNRVQTPQKAAVSNEDFIVDLDDIIKSPSHQMQEQPAPIPLDPGVGGMSVSGSALQAGDLIISTTNSTISAAIRAASNSPVSHASVYLGNNTAAEILGNGIHIWSLEESLTDDNLAVAYRHKDMTPAKAAQIELFIRQAKDNNTRYDYFSLIRVLPNALIENYCRRLPESSRQRCVEQAQNFRLGTDTNHRFYCSELIFEALRHAGLTISTTIPGWSTPNDIVPLEHDNTLSYVGHLKTSA